MVTISISPFFLRNAQSIQVYEADYFYGCISPHPLVTCVTVRLYNVYLLFVLRTDCTHSVALVFLIARKFFSKGICLFWLSFHLLASYRRWGVKCIFVFILQCSQFTLIYGCLLVFLILLCSKTRLPCNTSFNSPAS